MKTLVAGSSGMADVVPARVGWARQWPRWTPYAAVAWSLVYAALGLYWAVSGHGFPFNSELESAAFGPIAGQFGSLVAWIIVIMEGLPAVVVGVAMLRGRRSKALRSLLIAAGALLSGVLLLLMTGLDLLMKVGYIPGAIWPPHCREEPGLPSRPVQWTTIHQLLCLIGGFLWLAATVSYARRSTDACLYCGRRDGPEGWTSPRATRHAGGVPRCTWRWWHQSSMLSPASFGRWGSHWG